MDQAQAAALLSVAAHEVVEVRQRNGWWEARHHDMASHEETWRPVAPAAADEPDDDTDGVPAGSAAQVMEWVGADPARAAVALAAERARDKPRSTLVAALEKLVG